MCFFQRSPSHRAPNITFLKFCERNHGLRLGHVLESAGIPPFPIAGFAATSIGIPVSSVSKPSSTGVCVGGNTPESIPPPSQVTCDTCILALQKNGDALVSFVDYRHTLSPFRAPKSLPILTSSNFVPKKGFQCCKGVLSLWPKGYGYGFTLGAVLAVARDNTIFFCRV